MYIYNRVESDTNRGHEKMNPKEKISLYVQILNALEGVRSGHRQRYFTSKKCEKVHFNASSTTPVGAMRKGEARLLAQGQFTHGQFAYKMKREKTKPNLNYPSLT